MSDEMQAKEILEQARSYAYEYLDGIDERDVFPFEVTNLSVLKKIYQPILYRLRLC